MYKWWSYPFNAKVTLQPFINQTDMRVEVSQISIILQNKTVPLRTAKLRHHRFIKKNEKTHPRKLFGVVTENVWQSENLLHLYTFTSHRMRTVSERKRKNISAAASQMTINHHQPPIFSPHIFIRNSENERHLPGKQSPSREPDCASFLTATNVVRE